MRQQRRHYLLALGFVLGATSTLLADSPTFTVIDFPGAAFTEANGISPRGDVIGDYAATLTGSGPHHGFVFSQTVSSRPSTTRAPRPLGRWA
jgi:hypothetical protein